MGIWLGRQRKLSGNTTPSSCSTDLTLLCFLTGDSNRVLTQKFECSDNELMRGISKDNSNLDSFLSCTKVGKAEENAVYETSFPPRSNRVARRNWQNWKMNVTCDHSRRRFMCGVRMVAPGAGKDYE